MSPDPARPGGAGSFSPAAQQVFDAALDAHDRGMLEKAESLYRQAVAADGRMAVAHNNLGMVLIDLGRYDEAVASLRRAIELQPDYAEAYNNLGFVSRKLGRDPEAADAYERFLQLAPDVEDAPKIREWIGRVRAANPPPAPAELSPSIERTILDLNQTMPELPPLKQDPLMAAASGAVPLPLEPVGQPGAASAQEQPAAGDLTAQAEAEAADFFAGAAAPAAEAEPETPAAPRDEIPPEIEGLYTQAMNQFQDGELEGAVKLCQEILEKCPGDRKSVV